MNQRVRQFFEAVKYYPALPVLNRLLLRTWLSSMVNFILAVFKFIMGCVMGNGYLCVSALYSCLIGAAKRRYIAFEGQKENGDMPEQFFQAMGICITSAGAVYGVYLGRLILYPSVGRYTLPESILIALVSFIDVGIAVYSLLKKKSDSENELLSFGRKLVGLSSALPAIVMTQIALNAVANENNTAVHDGILGSSVGFILFGIGVWMVLYARKRMKKEWLTKKLAIFL